MLLHSAQPSLNVHKHTSYSPKSALESATKVYAKIVSSVKKAFIPKTVIYTSKQSKIMAQYKVSAFDRIATLTLVPLVRAGVWAAAGFCIGGVVSLFTQNPAPMAIGAAIGGTAGLVSALPRCIYKAATMKPADVIENKISVQDFKIELKNTSLLRLKNKATRAFCEYKLNAKTNDDLPFVSFENNGADITENFIKKLDDKILSFERLLGKAPNGRLSKDQAKQLRHLLNLKSALLEMKQKTEELAKVESVRDELKRDLNELRV